MGYLVSRSWWCGAVVVGLMACGRSGPSPYQGSWKGLVTQQKSWWMPGQSDFLGPMGTEIPNFTWIISSDTETCGESLTVTVLKDCNVLAVPSGSGFAFTPGVWCEFPGKDGATVRYTVVGGSFEAKDMRVDGKVAPVLSGSVRFSTQTRGMKSGIYEEFTHALSDALKMGDSTSGRNRCHQVNDAPWEPEDWAAAAKCDAFIDRSAEGADRTVAITDKTFSPACLRIGVGQAVTYTGKWAISYGLLGNDVSSSAEGNPIPMLSGADPTVVTFARPGDYTFHSSAMTGLIRVR